MGSLSGIGILLLVLAVIAFIYWAIQNSKAGKIKTVPFKKPAEIAQAGMGAADAKQMVSTEGQMTGQPLIAPMSGQPCVYYEIEVTRGYHKTSTNAQGHTTKSHSTKSMLEQKQGTIFTITDGQSGVGVDCTKKPSFDLKEGHRSRVNIGLIVPGQVQFGNLRLQTESLAANVVGVLLGGETTDWYEGVEKIVPFVQGQTMYALGKLTQTPAGLAIGEAGTFSSLMLSDRGREAALGTAVKSAKIGLIVGAVLGVGGAVCTTLGFVMAPSEPPHTTPTSTASTPPASTDTPATTVGPSGAPTTKPATPAHPPTATHPATPPPSAKKPH